MNILSAITSIFKPAAELIDELHTSEEEKLQAKTRLTELYIGFIGKALDYETKMAESRAKIIEAEAKSENKLTSSWRPITMYTFLAMLVSWWFGVIDTPVNASEDVLIEIFGMLKIGIGGYIGSRGVEKVVPKAIAAFKERDAT